MNLKWTPVTQEVQKIVYYGFFYLVIVMHLQVIFLKKDFIVKNIKKTYEEPIKLLENSTIPYVFLIFLVL